MYNYRDLFTLELQGFDKNMGKPVSSWAIFKVSFLESYAPLPGLVDEDNNKATHVRVHWNNFNLWLTPYNEDGVLPEYRKAFGMPLDKAVEIKEAIRSFLVQEKMAIIPTMIVNETEKCKFIKVSSPTLADIKSIENDYIIDNYVFGFKKIGLSGSVEVGHKSDRKYTKSEVSTKIDSNIKYSVSGYVVYYQYLGNAKYFYMPVMEW